MDAASASPVAPHNSPFPPHATGCDQRLPYGFARRHGVFLGTEDEHVLTLFHTSELEVEVFAEVRRFCGRPFQCRALAGEEFDVAIGKYYESHSGDAQQAAEDLGDDIDLTTLAENLPETADLLEQQDDAPVIRLINAILAEAV